MVKINREALPMQSVCGDIRHPHTANPYYITAEGQAVVLPAMGGITYNAKIGDSVYGWAADHLEPGVTIKNPIPEDNAVLTLLSCIGNEAVVVTGEAKGAKGFVTGTHGGCEHVLICFRPEDMEKMAVYDKIQIKAWGQGMALADFPDIRVMNLSPDLFERMNPTAGPDGRLQIHVAAKVPAYLMGSGYGENTAHRGDYDIMTTDRKTLEELGLDHLRFGDIVLLEDCDTSYGRAYLKGAVTVGIVIHGDCVRMGHGPGVTSLFTCKTGRIEGILDPDANLSVYYADRM